MLQFFSNRCCYKFAEIITIINIVIVRMIVGIFQWNTVQHIHDQTQTRRKTAEKLHVATSTTKENKKADALMSASAACIVFLSVPEKIVPYPEGSGPPSNGSLGPHESTPQTAPRSGSAVLANVPKCQRQTDRQRSAPRCEVCFDRPHLMPCIACDAA